MKDIFFLVVLILWCFGDEVFIGEISICCCVVDSVVRFRGVGMGLRLWMLSDFLCLGVLCLVGGNSLMGIMDLFGLMMWEVVEYLVFRRWLIIFLV